MYIIMCIVFALKVVLDYLDLNLIDLIHIDTDGRYGIIPHSRDETYVIGTLKNHLNETF